MNNRIFNILEAIFVFFVFALIVGHFIASYMVLSALADKRNQKQNIENIRKNENSESKN